MYNHELKVTDINLITPGLIREAIELSFRDGVTSIAPLGFSGDSIVLFGQERPKRVSVVSIRCYCGNPELLITDESGHFLFYGRFHFHHGIDFVVDNYYKIFLSVKDNVEDNIKFKSVAPPIVINETAEKTIGFDMINAYNKFK